MKPKKTILCVDDNEQALSIRKILLETRGYRVIACNSGEMALEAFRRGGVDLVLTDLHHARRGWFAADRRNQTCFLRRPRPC